MKTINATDLDTIEREVEEKHEEGWGYPVLRDIPLPTEENMKVLLDKINELVNEVEQLKRELDSNRNNLK